MASSTNTSAKQIMKRKRVILHGRVDVLSMIVLFGLILLLVLIIIPKDCSPGRKALDSTVKANLQILRNALATYEADMGSYPSDLKGLYDSTGIKQRKRWKGPYLKAEGAVIGNTAVPFNPYCTTSTVTDHWTYSASTGTIVPNTPGNDAGGKPYSQY